VGTQREENRGGQLGKWTQAGDLRGDTGIRGGGGGGRGEIVCGLIIPRRSSYPGWVEGQPDGGGFMGRGVWKYDCGGEMGDVLTGVFQGRP